MLQRDVMTLESINRPMLAEPIAVDDGHVVRFEQRCKFSN